MSSDSAHSTVSYTPTFFEARSWSIPTVDPYEEATRQALKQASPLLSPAHIADADSEEDPEEDPADHPADEGDDDDDDDFGDDADDEDEEEDDNKEEEHLAPADSSDVLTVDHVPSAEDTKAFETDESAPTPALIAEYAAVPTLPSPPPSPLTPLSSPLSQICSPPLPLPSPPTHTSPTYAEAPLGYRVTEIRLRATSLLPLPAPSSPLLPPAIGRSEDVLEADERAMAAIRVVNLRVSYQADVHRRESEEFYTRHQDAQDDRTAVRAKIKKSKQPKTGMAMTAMIQGVAEEDECLLLTIRNQVKYATCTLLGNALTWWNSHVKTVGHNTTYGMPWKTLMKLITNKYCPRGEIKKLDIEIWNLKVKGTDVESYTQRFQELALLCGRMFPEESDKVEKYVEGLPNMIQGSVMAFKPKKMQDAIEFATKLMDQKIRILAQRQAENKRKFEDTSRNNQNKQHPFKGIM
nr:reverse transcriptase domain-containing protein [Tanacetum cinerariifolium]